MAKHSNCHDRINITREMRRVRKGFEDGCQNRIVE